MQPLTERFGNPLTTAGAVLRRIPRVNVYHMTTGACCLVRRAPHKLPPSDVRNGLRQAMVLHQVGNPESFKGQHAMVIDQASSGLVAKVIAAVGNTLMNMSDD